MTHRYQHLAGVDEVGRGCLAGDVHAAAVILDPKNPITGLEDSKKLSAKKRNQLDIDIREKALAWCVATATVEEIDGINILQASMLAMQRAVNGLVVKADFALVDGNRTPGFYCPSRWLVKGDSKHDAIKAASIIAKVARDAAMVALNITYPEYGLAQHKGYPTVVHLAALKAYGPSPIHRMSFAPCKKYAVSTRYKTPSTNVANSR